MTVVADASVLVDLILHRPAHDIIRQRLRREDFVSAPFLIDVEFLSALRRLASAGEVAGSQAELALEDYLAFRINRYAHEPLLPLMWQIRGNLSAYDAAYVTLAAALGAPLLTRDARLAKSAAKYVKVELMNG